MTMPSPRRVARRSIAALVGMGMTKTEAARVVTVVCDEVATIIWRRDPDLDVTWLALIANEAGTVAASSAAAAAAVQTYSQRVATWARQFDAGHAPRIEQQDQGDRRPGA